MKYKIEKLSSNNSIKQYDKINAIKIDDLKLIENLR